jgi:GT2 family glycosyltransferase
MSGEPEATAKRGEVGVIVIGRNEGERLIRCLRSVLAAGTPAEHVVYVDSGSTDGSVDAARVLGAKLVTLDMSKPFTAARARNSGFDALLASAPDVPLVQFIDGDCELEAGWLAAAAESFARSDTLAALCGSLRERRPEASVYNRLADMEWKRPAGDVRHCGGIFTARCTAFRSVGGFDEGIAAGEEPELCERFRAAGWKVQKIDAAMATHDLAMKRFSQWWFRSVRGGYGAAKLTVFGPQSGRRIFRSQVRSAVLWAAGVPLAGFAAGACLLVLGQPTAAAAAAAATLAILLLQSFRIGAKGRRAGLSTTDATYFGLLSMLSKFAALQGFVQCLADQYSAPGRGVASPKLRRFDKPLAEAPSSEHA